MISLFLVVFGVQPFAESSRIQQTRKRLEDSIDAVLPESADFAMLLLYSASNGGESIDSSGGPNRCKSLRAHRLLGDNHPLPGVNLRNSKASYGRPASCRPAGVETEIILEGRWSNVLFSPDSSGLFASMLVQDPDRRAPGHDGRCVRQPGDLIVLHGVSTLRLEKRREQQPRMHVGCNRFRFCAHTGCRLLAADLPAQLNLQQN